MVSEFVLLIELLLHGWSLVGLASGRGSVLWSWICSTIYSIMGLLCWRLLVCWVVK